MGGAMPVDDDGKDRDRFKALSRNHHPTVKPTDLMAYLCRLVTPKGGIVLDPFCGSGSTGKAAVREGFDFIGIELDAEYCKIAEARVQAELDK
jgi:site-specific DNA-methyltransferase (adenine-specific)